MSQQASIHVDPPPVYPKLPAFRPVRVRIESISENVDDKYPNADGTPKVRLTFVLTPTEPELAASRVWAFAGKTWGKKGKLREIVRAAIPRDFTEQELFALDLATLVGRELAVLLKYKDDSEYARVEAYCRLDEVDLAPPAAPTIAPEPAHDSAESEADDDDGPLIPDDSDADFAG
jgi:hypothetical protein